MKLTIVRPNGEEVTIATEPKFNKAMRLFGKGFAKGATNGQNLTCAAGLGLWQGMKYKGDIKRGVLATVVVDVGLGIISGVAYASEHWNDPDVVEEAQNNNGQS